MLNRIIFSKFPSVIIITLAQSKISDHLRGGEGNFFRAINSIEFKNLDDLDDILKESTRDLRIILTGTGASQKMNDELFIFFLKVYFILPHEGTFCISMPPFTEKQFLFKDLKVDEFKVVQKLPEKLEKFSKYFFKLLESDQIFAEGHVTKLRNENIAY